MHRFGEAFSMILFNCIYNSENLYFGRVREAQIQNLISSLHILFKLFGGFGLVFFFFFLIGILERYKMARK